MRDLTSFLRCFLVVLRIDVVFLLLLMFFELLCFVFHIFALCFRLATIVKEIHRLRWFCNLLIFKIKLVQPSFFCCSEMKREAGGDTMNLSYSCFHRHSYFLSCYCYSHCSSHSQSHLYVHPSHSQSHLYGHPYSGYDLRCVASPKHDAIIY